MSKLTYDRVLKLQQMGRPLIDLPSDIFFDGNEKLQKAPGAHHRPEFRDTGTFNHPNVVAYRKRVAMDRVKRLAKSKMSDVEFKKMGGLEGLKKDLAEHGLDLDEKTMDTVSMESQSIDARHEMKKIEREEQIRLREEATGRKHEPILAEPVNPNEDILKAAIAARSAKVSSSDDLSSGDDDEKDNNKPSPNVVYVNKDGDFDDEEEMEPGFKTK